MSFNKWFKDQEMLIDVERYRIRAGFLLRDEGLPFIEVGASEAWSYQQKEIDKLTEENEKLKKTQLKETYDFHVESIATLNEQLVTQCTYMSDLQKKNEKLKEVIKNFKADACTYCKDFIDIMDGDLNDSTSSSIGSVES